MIVLDSDVVIDILRGVPSAVAWFMALSPTEAIVVPGFAAMEIIWGARDKEDQRQTQRWLSACEIVWLEPQRCQQALDTLIDVHLRNAIDSVDLLVAQVAISLDAPLHTFNQKHFNAVQGLKTVRPYTR